MKTIVHGRESADNAQHKTRPRKKNGLGKGFKFFWWVFVLVWFFSRSVLHWSKIWGKGEEKGGRAFFLLCLDFWWTTFFLCWINRAAWRSMLGEVRFLKAGGACADSCCRWQFHFAKFSYTVSWKRLYNALSNKCNNKKIVSGCHGFVFIQFSRTTSPSLPSLVQFPAAPGRCFVLLF